MIARLSKVPDERGLILGIDKGDVFEPGIVYQAVKILDEIILRPIGPSAIVGAVGIPGGLYSDVNDQVYHGRPFLTKEEFDIKISRI